MCKHIIIASANAFTADVAGASGILTALRGGCSRARSRPESRIFPERRSAQAWLAGSERSNREGVATQLHTELTIFPPPSLFNASCSAA